MSLLNIFILIIKLIAVLGNFFGGGNSCVLLEYLKKAMDPRLQKNAHAHKMYFSTQGVLGPPDIVEPALKENGSIQQVLFKFYFGGYYLLLKKSQVVIIQVILQSWKCSLLDRYYRGMIKVIKSNSIVFQLTKANLLWVLTEIL